MSKIEARKIVEKSLATGGIGAILVSLAEDYKPALVATAAAGIAWGRMKWTDGRRSSSTKQDQLDNGRPSLDGSEISLGKGSIDIQRPSSPVAYPMSFERDENTDVSDEKAQEEPEYPADTGVNTRTDAAETIAGLKEHYDASPFALSQLDAIEREEGLHDQPGRDVEIKSPGEADESLEELERSGVLSESSMNRIDAIQEHEDHGDIDIESDDGEAIDSGDVGNGDY